jgi:tRNA(Ile)-lysidine synthase
MKKDTEKIIKYINNNKMTEEGDSICVGLSGGADSVCLLQFLFEIKDRLKITVKAFHVNHSLRDEESDGDEEFARRFCEERHIEIKFFRYDIKKLAEENKKGLEETGRIARRQAAQICIEEGFASKIALAHHINDRSETVLFNMARGSSLSGLKGIAPVNGNIIRPLLCMTRKEIEESLKRRDIIWRTDSTNLEDDYSRNKIRLNVLPYLEKYINRQSVKHISAAASDIEEADQIIRELAEIKSEKLTISDKEEILIKPEILNEKKLTAGYILMGALKKMTGTLVDLTRGHTEDILALMTKQNGRYIELPYGIVAKRVYRGIELSKKKSEENKNREEAVRFTKEDTKFAGMKFNVRVFENTYSADAIPKKRYTKWFDYDKINNNCMIRFRNSGDYLITDKEGHKKKLKDYFIDEKIPKEERDRQVCFADGSKIIWVVGHRISEDCKVSEDTKKIIEISVSKERG